jgi:hypothetical protein
MIKFKPIVYNDGDFRSVKYTDSASTSVLEGTFCILATTGADLNTVAAKKFTGSGLLSTATVTHGGDFKTGRVFPIFHENLDPENVGATISENDFVVSFNMTPGNEFELHETVCVSGYASSWANIGDYAAVASTGLLTQAGGTRATGLVVAQVIGTFNAQWIRFRAI